MKDIFQQDQLFSPEASCHYGDTDTDVTLVRSGRAVAAAPAGQTRARGQQTVPLPGGMFGMSAAALSLALHSHRRVNASLP